MKSHQLGAGQFVHQKIAPTVNKVDCVIGCHIRIVLRGGWCDIVLSAHAQTEYRSDDSKGNFYEEFYYFPKYQINIVLGDFNVILRRKDILKQIIRIESLHEKNIDSSVRVAEPLVPEPSDFEAEMAYEEMNN
jgi:hypothetical protein